MKVTRVPMLNIQELEQAVELQYGLEPGTLDMVNLFSEEYENDTYHAIYFSDLDIEKAQEELDNAEWYNDPDLTNGFHYKLLILTYLHDVFPDDEYAIWLCCW